jgi:N-acetylneuraminic acid mutarotase
MNRPNNIARLMSELVLALVGLMIGFIVPGYCLDLPLSGPVAKTLLTSPSWFPTGNLNTARVFHTATLLQNGKVLVVGGRDNGANVLDSAELYDPVTGMWSVTGRLNNPRGEYTATLLPDGRVLVVGGDTSPWDYGPSTAERYDPGTGTWSLTGSLNVTRCCHSATLLQSGKVLVAGGFGSDSIKSAELYDPATGTWSPTGSLNVARYWHSATLLQDGRVLVAGGSNDGDLASTLSSAELYDPADGTWVVVANLSASGGVFHTATLLPNGNVLVAGGNGGGIGGDTIFALSELFDPATRNWSGAGNLAAARYAHTATLLPTGEVLVAGGTSQANHYPNLTYINLDSAEIYDSTTGTWTSAASLGSARGGHTATLLPDGRVLVAGGSIVGPSYTTIALNSAELYGNASPPGTIDSSFTGAWYDPAQNGHGLFVEILPGNRIFVGWFTFNPAGTEQTWFVGVGTYSGNTATITPVSLPTGGRWIPNFNPNQIVNNLWGTLTFTFTDADHGKVDFNSVLGYGTGTMNLTRLTRPAGLSTAATLRDAAATGTIGPGFTGSWYDPSQSGHGLFVEVLPDNRVFAGWFTFNPAGTEQAWFVGVGTYSGNTAIITPVTLPSGGRWIPNFNPNQIVNNFWGTLAFTFTDCNQGKVDFNSVLGYGTGSMNLTRLTQPAGLTCP